jgi:urease accessory protein
MTVRWQADVSQNPGAGTSREPLAPGDWLLWQLADSAFPSGGFAHSSGLEAAWQQGEIRGRDDLVRFAESSLRQLGHFALPFVTEVQARPDRLSELDQRCEACTTNHVANRASRLQGRALLASATRIFDDPAGRHLKDEPQPPYGHFAPVFGFVSGRLGLNRQSAARLFLFQNLRGLLAAAVRLGIVGPMEAQALQHRLAPGAEQILKRCQHRTIAEIAQTAPWLDLWQGAQDRLYSRLFQS